MSWCASHQPSVKNGSSPRVRDSDSVESMLPQYPAVTEMSTVHTSG